jgi:hypothetical protein
MKNKLKGKRIELISTTDLYTELKPGDRGTVDFVDDMGTIHINWDNGSQIGLVPGEDQYKLLENE